MTGGRGRAASGGIEPPLGGGRPAAAAASGMVATGPAARFDLGPRRRARGPSLTPMIDVVFLLLVFFMLAARFGIEARLPVSVAVPGGVAQWSGPPRLVEVAPEGPRLNGVAMAQAEVLAALDALVRGPDDPVILRARDGAVLQDVVAMVAALEGAGHRRVLVVE